jgi:hypothetical protein
MLTAATINAALALNNYFDDKKSWEAAQAMNRAAPVRKYLETHPAGRWRNEATKKVESLYDAAEAKYKASLNEGYDPKAAEAVLAILKYARSSQNFRVKVAFERHNEIPADLIEQLKKEFEVKKISPLGDVLSDEKMSRREKDLSSLVSNAFRRIIPEDILEFTASCVNECVSFNVKYVIDAGDSIYYDDREKDVPHDDRTFNPGIFITWNFGIQIPGQQQNYNLDLESLPASHFNYETSLDELQEATMNMDEVLKAEMSNVYDSMVASAFSDFRSNLIYRMGIGDNKDLNINKPIEEDEDTPPVDKGEPVSGT